MGDLGYPRLFSSVTGRILQGKHPMGPEAIITTHGLWSKLKSSPPPQKKKAHLTIEVYFILSSSGLIGKCLLINRLYRCINSHLSDRLQVIEKSEDISSEPVSPDLPDLEISGKAGASQNIINAFTLISRIFLKRSHTSQYYKITFTLLQ